MVLYAMYGLDEHSGTYGKFLRFLASGSYISGVYLIARRFRSFMHLQTLGAWAVYMHLESACRASCAKSSTFSPPHSCAPRHANLQA